MYDCSIKPYKEVTILTGVNGSGKTTILRMINFLFNKKMNELIKIPFTCFDITFEDDTSISISKFKKQVNSNSEYNRYVSNNVDYFDNLRSADKYVNALNIEMRSKGSIIDQFEFEEEKDNLENKNKIIYFVTNKFDTNGNLSNRKLNQEKGKGKLIFSFLNNFKVNFIDTNRLNSFRVENVDNSFNLDDAIIKYSKELYEIINNSLRKYNQISKTIDSKFPVLLFESNFNDPNSKFLEELNNDQKILEMLNYEVLKANLLDNDINKIDIYKTEKEIDNFRLGIYSSYLKSMINKLMSLKELSNKINLFTGLVNSKLSNKKIQIDKDIGFFVKSLKSNSLIPLNLLSSGEQHLIVLYYSLIFNLNQNSIMLMDEPEISLHLSWQLSFLDDVVKISKLNKAMVMVATHSPEIIGSYTEFIHSLG